MPITAELYVVSFVIEKERTTTLRDVLEYIGLLTFVPSPWLPANDFPLLVFFVSSFLLAI